MLLFALHDKIQCQSQQSIVPLLFAVACDKQQKDDHHQITGIKILGQQLLKEAAGALLGTGLLRMGDILGTGWGTFFRLFGMIGNGW